jgi:hypothetical protein
VEMFLQNDIVAYCLNLYKDKNICYTGKEFQMGWI